MITRPTADLLFAERGVLVRALDLAGQAGIARCEDGRALRYVHLLFDRHEIVCANGLWSESYHPGPETMNGFDVEAEAELRRLFPELYEGMGARALWPRRAAGAAPLRGRAACRDLPARRQGCAGWFGRPPRAGDAVARPPAPGCGA